MQQELDIVTLTQTVQYFNKANYLPHMLYLSVFAFCL